MNDFLTFISSNPIVLYILLGLVIVIVITGVLLAIDAYRKGRPVSLWLLKLEERARNSESNSRKTNIQHEIVELANRHGFEKSFMERLEKAQSVYLMGINLDSIIADYHEFITAKAKSGCRFKFLMVDQHFFEMMGGIAFASWSAGLRSQRDLGHAINTLEDIFSKLEGPTHENNIELRFIPLPPPYTMLAINSSSGEGEIQIELYTFELETPKRPHFILTPDKNSHWYAFFQNEFNLAWAGARPYKPLLGTKQIREKAGLVVYRKSINGKYEFLVITARLRPRAWIFPMGSKEKGESLEQAAIREAKEESGYIGNVETFLGSIQVDRGEVIDQIAFFLAEMNEEQTDREFDRQRKWVEIDELNDMILGDFKGIVQAVKICMKSRLT
jgi:8-oxo-dGTP pyrophosphatase MutT (NUDIX family)